LITQIIIKNSPFIHIKNLEILRAVCYTAYANYVNQIHYLIII